MTEKEFLEKFMDCYWEDKNEEQEETIDRFLQTIHKEYYEVEFVKKQHPDDVGFSKTNPTEINAYVVEVGQSNKMEGEMTEKEFVLTIFRHIWPDALARGEEELTPQIESFLDYHHKEYYEVEFVRKDETIEEQLVREFGFDPNDLEEIDLDETPIK